MEDIIDLEENKELPLKEVKKVKGIKDKPKVIEDKNKKEDKVLINCLRNEKVIVKHIPKLNGIWGNNPKHVLSGGMAEGSIITFVVPKLSSGMYVNVLTDDEKAFLEDIMGLEYNALSIYKKEDNFWDDSNYNGINKVRLTKEDNYLNLADPEDYIKYKILLANKNDIAPSMQILQDMPRATYKFVIIAQDEENKVAKMHMNATMQCYKEFGKIEDDKDVLKFIIETIDGRPLSKNVKLDFLQTKSNELIQSNSKLFLKVINDPLIDTKVLIKKSVEQGFITSRGNFLYLRDGNLPLCEDNQDPTLSNAAKYLNLPKHQELKFSLEAKTK